MKSILIILAVTFSTISSSVETIPYHRQNNKLVNIRVPNFAEYSTPVEVYSVFGEKTGCKISLFENNTSGKVIIQYSNDNKETWNTLVDGQYINGQSVWCRVKGLGGSGSVKLKIQ